MHSALALLLQESAGTAIPGLTLSWIDWVGVALAGCFLLLGLIRGLWWQVIRLVGLIAAVALARILAGPWGTALEEASQMSPEVATGIVWVGLLLAGIAITALVGILGKKTLQAMKLGLVDRFGGALAGLATGVIVHLAFLVVLAHIGPQPWTQQTLEGTYSRKVLQTLTTRWPVLTRGETAAAETIKEWLGGDPEPKAD